MYSKVFASMFDGTLATKGPWEVLVTFQQMLILANRLGVVDMTAEAISRRTTIPLAIIETGIPVLEAPDPESRSSKEDGRRITRLHPDRAWGWQIVNWDEYNRLRSAEERREYLREYMRDYRKQNVNRVNNVNHVNPSDYTHTQTIQKTKIAPPDGDAEKVSTEKLPRPRDLLWEAVITACGLDGGTPTDRERKAWNGAVKSLRAARATPGEVTARAACYRARWPHVSLTPTALARRWTECVAMVDER